MNSTTVLNGNCGRWSSQAQALKNKRYRKTELLSGFRLNGNTDKFRPQAQMLEPPITT